MDAPVPGPFRDPCVGTDGRPREDVRNLRLVLEYDGRSFSGWQRQPGVRTVQQVLEDALTPVLGHTTVVRGAGRTDAGVHAWAQVANVFTTSALATNRILRAINGIVGEGLRAVLVDDAPRLWDARRDALGKHYCYRLILRPSALLFGRAWIHPGTIDLGLLADELATLPGCHDWSSFRAADCTAPNPVKELFAARVVFEPRDVVALHFEGEGFLKQQVRAMVGTAVGLARKGLPRGTLATIRERRDRNAAGATAPAEGLYLERVLYTDPP